VHTAISARAVAKTFGYVGFTLLIAACSAALLAAAVPVGPGLFWAAFAAGLTFIVALAWGSDHFRLSTLRTLLTGFALSEGVFWAFVVQRTDTEALLAAAIAAGVTFIASAAWGYRTRCDLSGWEPVLFHALVGLLGAVVLCALLDASGMVTALSAIGILLFSAYTAYDVNHVRVTALTCDSEDELSRLAVLAAVALYLDLANLVVDFLRYTGDVAHDAAVVSWDVLGILGDVVGAVAGFVFDLFGGLTS
jgi:FtsH-binding integral membrane protein